MINFREVSVDDARKILDWRTSTRIADLMASDIDYDIGAQKQWLKESFNKPDYYHWIIQYCGKDVGFLNFADWNREAKSTSWGFYIGEEDGLGVGGIVAPYFYNFAFEKLGVNTVYSEVFYHNVSVIDLHLEQGYKFAPDRDHAIVKNGKSVLMISLSLDKYIFRASRFSKLKKNLPILKWKAYSDEFKRDTT